MRSSSEAEDAAAERRRRKRKRMTVCFKDVGGIFRAVRSREPPTTNRGLVLCRTNKME